MIIADISMICRGSYFDQLTNRISTQVTTGFDIRCPTPELQCFLPSPPLEGNDVSLTLSLADMDHVLTDASAVSGPRSGKQQCMTTVQIKSEDMDLDHSQVTNNATDYFNISDNKGESEQEYMDHLNRILTSSQVKSAIKMETGRVWSDEECHRHGKKRRTLVRFKSPDFAACDDQSSLQLCGVGI